MSFCLLKCIVYFQVMNCKFALVCGVRFIQNYGNLSIRTQINCEIVFTSHHSKLTWSFVRHVSFFKIVLIFHKV
jgi:hypothetical protein